MRLTRFLLLFFVAFYYALVPSYSMEDWKDIFSERGKPFRRDKSPIYLEWSAGSSEKEKSPGFHIHVYETKSQIGAVGIQLDFKRAAVQLASFSINVVDHSTEVFRTLTGIFKAKRDKLPEVIKHLFHICDWDRREIIKAAQEAGFNETHLYPINPSKVYLIKDIPDLVLTPSVDSDKNPLISESIPKTMPLMANAANAFEVGKTYTVDLYKKIYLQFFAEVDAKNVLGISLKKFGFKIFRARKNDEIGFLVPSLEDPVKIYISAMWIDEAMRRKGYASQALLTFISLCKDRKAHFPKTEFFSFLTKGDNEAVLNSAAKAGFENMEEKNMREMNAALNRPMGDQQSFRGFISPFHAYIEFRKPFKDEKY